jgi:ParB family transcriptional regulator, chromosome partitioning protein
MKLDLKKAASDSKERYASKLTSLKDQEESSGQLEKLRGFIGKVVTLPIHFITIGNNVRQDIDEEDPKFKGLVQSIRDRSLLQNLVANLIEHDNGSWELRLNAGERRYRACKEAGIEAVPVLIKRWVSDIEEVYTGISENEERVNLSPLDLAEAYARLIKMGETVEEIAERQRRDKRTIRKYIFLSEIPDDVRKIIRERSDIFTTRVLFNEIASRKYSSDNELRDQIQKLIKEAEYSLPPPSNSNGSGDAETSSQPQINPSGSVEKLDGQKGNVATQSPRRKQTDPQLVEQVISRISSNIPVKVRVKGTPEKGRITISYASQEQLNQFLAIFQE